jgi:endogenous inhibitor of DNA gyrase (YacG/DUF329 family)
MNQQTQKKIVRCPHCGKDALYIPENLFRPFCSQRCRMIDLGEWADGQFRIPGEELTAQSILENFEKDENEAPH